MTDYPETATRLFGEMAAGWPRGEWLQVQEEVLEAVAEGRVVHTQDGDDGSTATITEYLSPLHDPPATRWFVEWGTVSGEDQEMWEAETFRSALQVAETLTESPAPEEPLDEGTERYYEDYEAEQAESELATNARDQEDDGLWS